MCRKAVNQSSYTVSLYTATFKLYWVFYIIALNVRNRQTVIQVSSDMSDTTYLYTGTKCPLILTITATRVFLEFTSDLSVQYSGFSIIYNVHVPKNTGWFIQ